MPGPLTDHEACAGRHPQGAEDEQSLAHRTEEYRQLALVCQNPEARQVIVHLARICIDMAGAAAAADQSGYSDLRSGARGPADARAADLGPLP